MNDENNQGKPPPSDAQRDKGATTIDAHELFGRIALAYRSIKEGRATTSEVLPGVVVPEEAMFIAAIGTAFKGMGLEPIERVMRMRSTLARETDRGCVLVAAAYLDDNLAELLRAFFIADASAADELLENNRPLGTFSSRIQACRALGLLSSTECRDLDLIRRVRNEFAHMSEELSFESPKIKDRCKSFSSFLHREGMRTRDQFTRAAMRLSGTIHFATKNTAHRSEQPPRPSMNISPPEKEQMDKMVDKMLNELFSDDTGGARERQNQGEGES
jgi:DNA-binding MltR family transcriptional regulator